MSTIPPDLFGSYQQYKSKNKYLSDWLLQTADKEAKPARLRQSRKRARRDNVDNSTLQPNEYLPLVRHIVGKKPRVDVPSSFIANLRSVIRQRRSFYDWFSSIGSSDRDLVEQNDRHLHFIRTLQEVGRLLTPLQEKKEQKAAPEDVKLKPNMSAKGEAVASFGALQYTESVNDTDVQLGNSDTVPEMLDIQAEGIFDEDKASDPMAEESSQPQKLSYKRLFAFHCLILDLQNIREYVKLRWDNLDRADGSEIMRVAVLTNTAIDLVVRLETDFRRTFSIPDSHDFRHLFVDPSNPSLSSLDSIEKNAEFFKDDPCELIFWGHVAKSFIDRKVQDVKDFEAAQAGKRRNRNARRAAKRREKRGDGPDSLPDNPQDTSGDLLPQQETSSNSVLYLPWPKDPGLQTKVHEEVAQLHAYFDIVLDFSSTAGASVSFIEDEILRRLRAAISDNLISLSTAFAVQLQSDINVAADEFASLYKRLDKVADSMADSVDRMHQKIEGWKESHGSNWVKSPSHANYRQVVDFGRCWLKRKQIDGSQVPFAKNYYQYVQQSPLAGSLLLFWCNLSEVKSCVDWSENTMVLMPLLHLYNLVRQIGALPTQWPEVEGLIETHGEDNVFLGKRPVGVDECWARFRAVMGIPADDPLPRLGIQAEEKKDYLARKRGTRRALLWKGFCPVSKLIQARLESVELEAVNFSADDVELALLGVQYGQRSILQQGDDGRLANRSVLWSKLSRTNRLKPLELLTSLETRLGTEIEDSRFNYLLFEGEVTMIATASARVMIAEGLEIGELQATGKEVSQADLEDGYTSELSPLVLCSTLIEYCRDQACLEEARRLEQKYYMNNSAFKRELLEAREQKARKLHIVVKEMDRWIRKRSIFGETTRKRNDRSYLLDHGTYADETEEESKERVKSLLPGVVEQLLSADTDTVDESMLDALRFMSMWADGEVTLERKERK